MSLLLREEACDPPYHRDNHTDVADCVVECPVRFDGWWADLTVWVTVVSLDWGTIADYVESLLGVAPCCDGYCTISNVMVEFVMCAP